MLLADPAFLFFVFIVVVVQLGFFSEAVAKAGFSRARVIPAFLPIVGIVLLWIFAFKRWPALPGR